MGGGERARWRRGEENSSVVNELVIAQDIKIDLYFHNHNNMAN